MSQFQPIRGEIEVTVHTELDIMATAALCAPLVKGSIYGHFCLNQMLKTLDN